MSEKYTSCGILAHHNGKFLFIKEMRNGKKVWNIPIGRKKSIDIIPENTALREFFEETRGSVPLVGLQRLFKDGNFVMFKSEIDPLIFSQGNSLKTLFQKNPKIDDNTITIKLMTIEEIMKCKNLTPWSRKYLKTLL